MPPRRLHGGSAAEPPGGQSTEAEPSTPPGPEPPCPTTELQAYIKKIAGTVSTSLCSGTAIDGVLQQIAQASDIKADGTQDPTQTCNGITVGFGMFLNPAKVDAVYTPPVQPTPWGPIFGARD